ncbi:MAG: DUF4830 domain-containing protein [Clostridiales bacterium]|nr:DUF4830 domain-containing protein [Clostridiales bacterium]MCD7827999.1 DUF4830 domain-containing protein [Clostridiales bacterium]
MFILSLKSLRGKLLLLSAVVIAAAAVCFICFSEDDTASDDEPTSEKSISAETAVNYSAENEEQRLSFISQFGYTVDRDPVSAAEVVIPKEFDSVYEEYNNLQKMQNLDLEKYKGCTVKKWTYTVTNYPGFEDSESIRITLLVYKGKVIGGDVCSVALDGFMTTFQ